MIDGCESRFGSATTQMLIREAIDRFATSFTPTSLASSALWF